MLANVNFTPYLIVASLILIVAAITVTTLIFSTKQVTKGYVLNALDAETQKLIKEQEVYDMEISKLRALNDIKKSSKVEAMVYPRDIAFVNGDTALAKR